jgi:hypothetical protein
MYPKISQPAPNRKNKNNPSYIKTQEHVLDMLLYCPECGRVWTQWYEGKLFWETYQGLCSLGLKRLKCPDCSDSKQHQLKRSK